jgi:hypothetical protein
MTPAKIIYLHPKIPSMPLRRLDTMKRTQLQPQADQEWEEGAAGTRYNSLKLANRHYRRPFMSTNTGPGFYGAKKAERFGLLRPLQWEYWEKPIWPKPIDIIGFNNKRRIKRQRCDE